MQKACVIICSIFSLSLLALFSVSCCSLSGSTLANSDVAIKKKLERNLNDFKNTEIYLSVLNADMMPNPMQDGVAVTGVKSEIEAVLDERGIGANNFSKKNAKLWIECIFRMNYGLPRIGRNFKIYCTYFGMGNIRLTDAATGIIIGEIEYKKPFGSNNPSRLFQTMMSRLLESYTPPKR